MNAFKSNTTGKVALVAGIGLASIISGFAGYYKNITVDGDVSDWAGVAPAYVNENGVNNPTGVDFDKLYLANDANYLYIRFTLQQSADPVSAYSTYIWLDNDVNASTGFHPFGNTSFGSSLMIINDQAYQQAGGGWNEGTLTNGNVAYGAAAIPGTEFEFRIARSVTGVGGGFEGLGLLDASVIGVQLASETGTSDSLPAWENYGTLFYTFEAPPAILTENLALVGMADAGWRFEESGTDLGVAWLAQDYDDSLWSFGNGLFGYTPNSGSYPTIQSALTSSGQNTYYYRTHFYWNNLADNVSLVVTNYLSDGAVYYLNGVEVRRVRMPSGAVTFATSATSTNATLGAADIFGFSPNPLIIGDNILEVETHQAPGSSSDMVFGMSLTAAAQYPIYIVDTNLPANKTVLAGTPVTFVADFIGSGPLTYQWLKDGVNVPNGTNATLTISQVLTNHAGSYALWISNSFGTNLTRAALLTVTNTPVGIADPSLPADTYAVEGLPVTLSVVASGSPMLEYQWFKNGSPVTDATNATLTLDPSTLADAGNYYAIVSNPTGSTNSRTASLTMLADKVAPGVASISALANELVIKYSSSVDPASATNISNYSLSGGVGVTGAVLDLGDDSMVTLSVSPSFSFGTVYELTVNGVMDLFGNAAHATVPFVRSILIDGSFGDWQGVAPIYSGPIGTDGAADFKDIYLVNDDAKYYFRVTLWHDIPPGAGQFPLYVNMFFDTDGSSGTGYSAVGSEVLVQSGYSYQQKNGGFNEGGINGLDWFCLPATPGTNFEFSVSRAATYASDSLPVFTTNMLSFLFQGMNTSFVGLNLAPQSGVLSYTNAATLAAGTLPIGPVGISSLAGGKVALIWETSGNLQASGSVSGGSWTNVPAATSPYVIPASGTQMFFRLAE